MCSSNDYEDRPYFDRVSSVLKGNLHDAFNEASINNDKAIYHRNIFATLDYLEGFGNPAKLASIMKHPGEFSGLLFGYEHSHYAEATNISYFRNFERLNGLKKNTISSPEDIAKFIFSQEKKTFKEVFSKIQGGLDGSEGFFTGHWLVYRKGKDGLNRYLDSMEHVLRNSTSEKEAKDKLDIIFAEF